MSIHNSSAKYHSFALHTGFWVKFSEGILDEIEKVEGVTGAYIGGDDWVSVDYDPNYDLIQLQQRLKIVVDEYTAKYNPNWPYESW
ncbi:hypothetical protein [Larkinella humicola]|uniref:Uncharacterized protein n=1 Tax=Larkinella humicola TaxID=2607654 RepID=A0A5N1JBI7_9BACT|nr:hypothetical protein [Larkinella humicola]KAA9349841.1 hypothetical protein F0P93_20585 [Larkinella humicola]